jgi:putative endonuclease
MFSVYVLENPRGKRYTGSTSNLDERLVYHNDTSAEKARFHKTTYKKGPWRIIFSKEFKSRNEALGFEKYLKTGKGRQWLERARLGG